jgi:predicted transcriptional regulator of viral defense system
MIELAIIHDKRENETIMTTHRGLKLLDKLAGQGRTAFTAAEARHELHLSPQATSNVLGRLVEAGLVDRVGGGRYAIRPIGTLGTAAIWDDLGSAVAAGFAGHPHRIGFLTALDHHGLLVRPVRAIDVASAYRPRLEALSGRPLHVIRETPATVLVGTQPLGPSRVATVERALLDAGSRPRLVGGASRLAEALSAAHDISGLADLARHLHASPAYRRVGSISTTLSLASGRDLEPPSWRTVIELDPTVERHSGWIDKTWGVAWPYPSSELRAVTEQ